jgi:hypothetical protein
MAFRFVDGCDGYAASGDIVKKWNSRTGTGLTYQSTAGKFGGGSIQGAASVAGTITSPNIFGGISTGIVCFGWWLKHTVNSTANSNWFSIGAGGGFRWNASGQMVLFCLNGAGIATGSKQIGDNQFHWIEMKLNIANSSNLQRVLVDGVSDINVTANLAGASGQSLTTLGFTDNFTGVGTLDDIIAYDDTTGCPTTSDFPLGPRRIVTCFPNGDSAVQFAPNAGGTNYTQVDEAGADDDTTYVQGATGQQDLYDFQDLPYTPADISGVMLNVRWENPGAGTVNGQLIGKSSSTQRNGSSILVPAAYGPVAQQEFGVDPNTSAAWTASNLNSAKFGQAVV